MDNIKNIMSTQLSETEVMVFLLVREGKTFRDIEGLPFGFTYETARKTYKTAAKKVQSMVKAGILEPNLA